MISELIDENAKLKFENYQLKKEIENWRHNGNNRLQRGNEN